MNTLTRFLAILMLIFAAKAADAQIQDRAKDRAERKANNRVDRKIDEGLDKGFDAIEGLFKRKNKDKDKDKDGKDADSDAQAEADANEALMNGLFGASDVDLKPSYDFDHSVTMRSKVYDKKGKEEMVQDMEMMMADDHPHIGIRTIMEGTSADMVMDLEENYMVILTDAGGSKMAMVTKFDPAAYETEEDKEMDAMEFTKTGRTKEILGYTCEEYVTEDDESVMHFWMADVEDLDFYKGFKALQEQQKQQGAYAEDVPEGMMLEMVSESKKNDEKYIMEVTSIDRNKSGQISTEGYKPMSFGGR